MLPICESCGGSARTVFQQRGGALWCRACVNETSGAERAHGTIRDEIPGGVTLHNLGPHPVTVYSHSERKAIMRSRGLREMVRHVEGSPHTTSWATMDPYTLEAAKALASRAGGYAPEWRTVHMRNPWTGDRIRVDYDAKNPETQIRPQAIQPADVPR